MKILALDTAHDACSVALIEDEELVFEKILPIQRGHAEALMPLVKEALETKQMDFLSLEAIAVCTGPGSFTGVRVGLATANGLGLAANLPVTGVSALEVQAFKVKKQCPDIKNFCVVLETKREDFYFQFFKENGEKSEPSAKTAQEIKAFQENLFIGNAVERLKEYLPEITSLHVGMMTAQDVALYALKFGLKEKNAHPLYLRDAEVSLCQK